MGFSWANECRAHSKRTGSRCKQPAMSNGVCRLHGGKSLRGIAHPNYQGKGRSKHLPGRLVPLLQDVHEDEELMYVRNDIALVEMHLRDMLEKIDTGECGAIWRELKKVHSELKFAKITKRTDLMAVALDKFDDVVDRGINDILIWDEIGKTVDRRQRLIESERKRMIEMNQMITNDRLHIIAARLIDTFRTSVLNNVQDENVVKAILSQSMEGIADLFPPAENGKTFEANSLTSGRV